MTRKLYLLLLFSLATTLFVAAQRPHIRSHNFTTREGLASNVVNTIIQDRQGYLWLGTNHGLTRFDGHRFANFYVEKEGRQAVEGINHIVEDTVRNVLLMSGKDYRLLCFDLARMQFTSAEGMEYPKSDTDDAEEAAFLERARQIGIERGNITNRRHDMHHVLLADGREVFTTIDNGFYIYDPHNPTTALSHFCSADANPVIESDYINDICLDRSGSVWLATTFAGIYQLDLDEGQLRYHTIDGSSGNFRSFSELPDGTIAVGDMDGNVFRFDPHTGHSQLIFHKGPRAYATRTDKQGRFWVGTRGGGVWVRTVGNGQWTMDNGPLGPKGRLTPQEWQLLDLPARQIFDICLDNDGTAWIGTFDNGLIHLKSPLPSPIGEGSGVGLFLPDEKIHQMLIDRHHRLWVATENGIFRRNGKDFMPIYNRCKAVCVAQGPADTIYVGSNGYGLLIIADDIVSHFTTSDGLANNCVEAIAVDDSGNIIAATDQGISIINRRNGTVQNVYSPLGLLADTYNEDAILRTSEGRIFLGSQRGLAELKTHPQTPLVREGSGLRADITSIEINDIPHYDDLSDEVRLTHSQNNLCFNFSSFAYKDLSSVIYSYWFEGIDRNWRPATRESRALYSELRPGHYRFHVRYRLSGGQWSPETVCNVHIAQPWWWTWWARAIYLLLIALFIWYEWHQYQRRLSLQRQLDQRLAVLYATDSTQKEDSPPALPVREGADTVEGSELPESKVTAPCDPDSTPFSKVSSPSLTGRAGGGSSGGESSSPFLDKLDQLILSNLLKTDLDVNFIAQEMCMSYSTLHRRIKSLTGITANEYVRKHRLTKAMQLLRDGHNASEVAMECGFSSPSYFTRCFKAEYGILPSEV